MTYEVTSPAKFVYHFSEGTMDMSALLGGKGANLAEMTRLGVPVPEGFTVTTAAGHLFHKSGFNARELHSQIDHHLQLLEQQSNRELGMPSRPLLVSVRSGAPVSMPGMMDTVLNLGLNDAVLAQFQGSAAERFWWDSYRRLIHMYGTTVKGIEQQAFTRLLERERHSAGAIDDRGLTAAHLRQLALEFQGLIEQESSSPFPQDPKDQIYEAIGAVFHSWNSPRAMTFREVTGIDEALGTAVTVQRMVFGNLDSRSGTGVVFSRNPSTGERGLYGEYLAEAQGEDVVSGTTTAGPLDELLEAGGELLSELEEVVALLERHYEDMCDVEFTVEAGKLWILQTRIGSRSAAAAFVIASQLVDDGITSMEKAAATLNATHLSRLLEPDADSADRLEAVTRGLAASPGLAVGTAIFDSEAAASAASEGLSVILVRTETDPSDIAGLVAAKGILTTRGGRTSHAAVVARGLGKPAVCGAQGITVHPESRCAVLDSGATINEGDIISIDGSTGEVFLGELRQAPSSVQLALFNTRSATAAQNDVDSALTTAVMRILMHRRVNQVLDVCADITSPQDTETALALGAAAIGPIDVGNLMASDSLVWLLDLYVDDGTVDILEARARLLGAWTDSLLKLFQTTSDATLLLRLTLPDLSAVWPDVVDLVVRTSLSGFNSASTDARLLEHITDDDGLEQRLSAYCASTAWDANTGLFPLQVEAVLMALTRSAIGSETRRVRVLIPEALDQGVQEVPDLTLTGLLSSARLSTLQRASISFEHLRPASDQIRERYNLASSCEAFVLVPLGSSLEDTRQATSASPARRCTACQISPLVHLLAASAPETLCCKSADIPLALFAR